MRVYKIHENLWRVSNDGKVKDVWVKFKEIQSARTQHDILTPTETQAIQLELDKQK